MARMPMALVVFVIAAVHARAGLAITDVQAAYGSVLPERQPAEYYARDLIFFRYVVTGVRPDADGEVNLETVLNLTDARGATAASSAMVPTRLVPHFGDGVAGCAMLALDGQVPPGEYQAIVTVRDRLSSEEATFRRPVRIKPIEFAVVAPQFFYDELCETIAPAGGHPLQHLYWRMNVIGFDTSHEQVQIGTRVEVLDAEGRAGLARPEEAVVRMDVVKGKEPEVATIAGSMNLTRIGRFILRFTMTDLHANQTARFEISLLVTAP